ncbi:MAG: hypothetical protein K2X87_20155 [Gemmataceae bacterium]|nr:hypothetical protein [Gemmataceae bacterium]
MPRLALLAVVLGLGGLTAPARLAAADRPDPLRYVPASAQFTLTVDHPRQLAEAVLGLKAVKDGQQLAPVREVLDGAAARRVFQMLGYLERELGADWPALLDQLAGGGIAVGGRFGDKAPAVLVVQGTDQAQAAKAFALFGKILDDELARQGAPAKAVRGTYRGADTLRLGDDVHAARAGAALLVASQEGAFRAALDLATGNGGESVADKESVAAARKLVPGDPLARLWVDLASVKEGQAAKDFFDATRKDFLQTLVVGSSIDCVKRSDFMAAGLYLERNAFRLAVRLPAGRDAFPAEFALHVPPAGKPGSLPLLEPTGVLYSQSFYLDLGYGWKHRDKLVNEQTLKDIAEGEKQISKVLPGAVKLGDLLEAWGPYHRLVAVNQEALPYKTRPGQVLPGFGYVATMADPKFGTAVASAARAGGLIASLQFGLKQVDAEHDGVKITAYRFREDKPLPDDPDGIRFNVEPCFATVGDQFIAASTVEVCKKLIDEVKRTAGKEGSPAVWRAKGYATPAGDALYAVPEPFVTDAVLRSGAGLADARKQVDALAAWVRTLGTARVEIDEAATEYRFDIVWEYGKN